MTLKFIQKKGNRISFLILLAGILFLSGCVQQLTPASNMSVEVKPTEEVGQGLQILIKDVGFPEVKYLQPTIKEIQLKDQSGNWITIWSSTEGKTVKLTPDGAEVVLDSVNLKAGTYTETRMLVPAVDVEADINRDGDTLDKNVQIILTEEEFANLPQQEKPSAPSQPAQPSPPSEPQKPEQAPEKPQKPEAPQGPQQLEAPQAPEKPQKPEAPSEPEKPSAPSQPAQPSPPSEPLPPGVIKREGGLVYMNEYHDEVETVTPPFFDGIHNDTYLYPTLKTNFVYGGSGGKLTYDFTLHPFKPKHEQVTVEVFINASTIVKPATVLPATVLFDDFNGVTKGKGFGTLTYEDSLPKLDKAVNLAKGSYIKYSFSPWYRWDGVRNWNRNEAAHGQVMVFPDGKTEPIVTEGRIEVWVNPRQYTGISLGERGKPQGILTFEWVDSESALEGGYILHLGFTADGKLTYSNWGGNLDNPLVGKTTIPLNQWTHVGVSWSPKGTNIYVDGNVDASTTANMWPAFSGSTQYVYLNYWGDSDFGLVDDLHILKVAEPSTTVPPVIVTENVTKNMTANITANVTVDVKISSYACSWTVKSDKYGYKSDCLRIIANGMAQGPVGTRVELPILSWSDDKFDCGAWTLRPGALIAVGDTCVRKEGQPETANWTVDTEGNECPLKNYFNNNRSYIVKIYKNDDLNPEKEDRKNTLCQ